MLIAAYHEAIPHGTVGINPPTAVIIRQVNKAYVYVNSKPRLNAANKKN
jgi:hypothetical protein